MNTEINKIIETIQEVWSGNPWYGRSVQETLGSIDVAIVYEKPNAHSHSLIELLYHMVTWVEFTQHRLEKDQHMDHQAVESLDWRETIPEIHTWNQGIAQLTAATNRIVELLKGASDELLEDKVDYRQYNFRYLLHGLIQHNIYHIGQIAYLKKVLVQ